MSDQAIYLQGLIAAEAALFSDARDVIGVYVDGEMDFRKLEPLRRAAKRRDLELVKESREALNTRAGAENHGGVLAHVGERKFITAQELLAAAKAEQAGEPFVVMLDGVEDPFNFGQALRSLYAAGCHGVVVRPRNWTAAGSAATVARASAGASELIPMMLADDPEAAAEIFNEAGLEVAAAAEVPDATPLNEAALAGPLFLLIGGEKRGVKRSFLDRCRLKVAIPYARPFDLSLGTVAATSVLAFEVARQRQESGKRSKGKK
ncbi:MAG: RNA methyltransferase [Algisphaera sp.]